MKYLKLFENIDFDDIDWEETEKNNKKEELDISIFYEEFKRDNPDNLQWINMDGIEIVLSTILEDCNGLYGIDDFPEMKNWKLLKVKVEKLDGYQESILHATFLRKNDNKKFLMWIHDNGGIGNALTVSEKIIEI